MDFKNNWLLRLKEEFAKDYEQISLWYFVAFLSGCIAFFAGIIHIDISQMCWIIVATIVGLIFFRQTILYRSILLIILFFTFGVLVSVTKEKNYAEALPVNKKFIALIEADISKITKVHQGTRVLLNNVTILEHNLLKQDPPQISANIRINIQDKYYKKIEIGDRIIIKASLMPPPKKVIPGGYDFEFYAKLNAIQAVGFCLHEPTVISKTASMWRGVQKKIYERLSSCLDPVSANFISALIIGDSQGLDRQTLKNIRGAGISHILCVSGLHLSLVTLLCFKFFRFWLNASDYLAHNTNIKAISGVLAVLAGYGYLTLSGSQVSATRAFIMCGLASLAISLQRDYSPIRATAISSFLILALNPEYVLHPSFQLSFLSVTSLILGYGSFSSIQQKAYGFFGKIKKDILANFYSSLFVGFTTGPIVVYHFHVFANYSAFANIVAIPITTFILMPCAFIFLFLSIFNLDVWVLKIMDYFVKIIVKTATYITALPYSQSYTGHIIGENIAVYMLGLFWFMIWKTRIRFAGLVLIAASFCMMINYQKPDLVFNIRENIVGFDNKDGEIELYSKKKLSNFTKEYWSLWFGKKESTNQILNRKENLRLTTKQNKIIDIIFHNLDCASSADLVINYSYAFCPSTSKVLQVSDLKKDFIFVWCSEKECYFRLYN